jgi:hypothetical protein
MQHGLPTHGHTGLLAEWPEIGTDMRSILAVTLFFTGMSCGGDDVVDDREDASCAAFDAAQLECEDNDPCTTDSAATCNSSGELECRHTPNEGMPCPGVFEGMMCNGQGQCELPPLGLCGNSVYDEGESCDNTSMQDCPSCDDSNPCTVDTFTGTQDACNIVCRHDAVPGCSED